MIKNETGIWLMAPWNNRLRLTEISQEPEKFHECNNVEYIPSQKWIINNPRAL